MGEEVNCPNGHHISHDNFTGCPHCADEEVRMVREQEQWEHDRPARIAAGEECPECGTTNQFNIDLCDPFLISGGRPYYYCANCGADWDKAADQTPNLEPGSKPKEKL